MAEKIKGLVARLVTDDELILNVGSEDGVFEGQIFAVLDPRTQNVKDPTTGKSLGSLDRIKARVAVIQVGEKLALARAFGRRNVGLSGAARVLSGAQVMSRLTSDTWPEGVQSSDPVVSTGRRVAQKVASAED